VRRATPAQRSHGGERQTAQFAAERGFDPELDQPGTPPPTPSQLKAQSKRWGPEAASHKREVREETEGRKGGGGIFREK